jgi:hypothetical protein
MVLGGVRAWQGRPGEAEPWIQRAERTVRAEAEPIAGMAVYFNRGVLELVRGRDAEALAAFRAAERLARFPVVGAEITPLVRLTTHPLGRDARRRPAKKRRPAC